MADADLAALPKARNVLVYASTWGEGDPPQRAADFYTTLMGEAAPRLDGVHFAVLALGDTAYANFCATGRAIDERLETLGGVRASPRIDLDLDFAKQAAAWTEHALGVLAPAEEEPAAAIVHVDFKAQAAEHDEPVFTPETPLEAEISPSSTSTARARHARPGTSRSPPERRCATRRATPSASSRRTIPSSSPRCSIRSALAAMPRSRPTSSPATT